MADETKNDSEILDELKGIKSQLMANTNTVAINTGQVIELRNEINNFLVETTGTRMAREHKEIAQLELELEKVNKMIEVAKTPPGATPKMSTSQKIRLELQKGKINWNAVWQTAAQAAAATVAVVGVWQIIKLLAANAP